jgi:hypothetical protein
MPEDQERAYLAFYRKKSDEQIYQYLRDMAAQLGRVPLKSDIPASSHIKSRLGNWPRILEKAGLKPMGEQRRHRVERRREKRRGKSSLKVKEA